MKSIHIGTEKLMRILEKFTEVDPDIPVKRIEMFLYIAQKECTTSSGVLINDLTDLMGEHHTTIYRNLTALEDRVTRTKVAPGFIEQVPDPAERRRKKIYLTPRGKEFYREILDILEAE